MKSKIQELMTYKNVAFIQKGMCFTALLTLAALILMLVNDFTMTMAVEVAVLSVVVNLAYTILSNVIHKLYTNNSYLQI